MTADTHGTVATARIRRMTARDVPAVTDLCDQLGYPSTREQVASRFARLNDRPDHALLVADRDGAPVGWIHIGLEPLLELDLAACVHGLIVAECERGRRVGERLLAEAERWAAERGCGVVRVRSNVVRERAHRFYLREGYRLVKTSCIFQKPLA
jgi:GNAT superfamily N-acetyltransferase